MDTIKIGIVLVNREEVKMFNALREYRRIHGDAHNIMLDRLLSVDNRTSLWIALVYPELEKSAGASRKEMVTLSGTYPTPLTKLITAFCRRVSTLRVQKYCYTLS